MIELERTDLIWSTLMSKVYRGTIESWQIHTINEGASFFTGFVVEDPTGRFEEGWHMRSSLIENFNRETGELETMNSTYKMDMHTEGMDSYFPDDNAQLATGVFY